ncbi:MAG: hypothetical protein LAO79_14475 [Acidobacteriia bacterium]|nr:hypothetical protein [Terriglobia bacterium]
MSSLRNIAIGLCLLSMGSRLAPAQGFVFFHEFYGSMGYTDPEAARHLEQGTANGLTFTPPVVGGVAQLAQSFGAKLMLRLPDASSPAGISDDQIEKQRAAYDALAAANPQLAFMWDLLPEWDQSGGSWVPDGRPQYAGLSKAAAHAKFTSYFQNRFPELMTNLSTGSRNYQLAAVTDYSPNVSDAYEMGVDLCMLERGIDELGDLSTGVAFLRGAAQQYGRAWGIDLSSWRTANGMATQYDNNNVLVGGWSASYLSRHYYAAFLAGANVVQNEAATYRNGDGQLNPFGQATQDFSDFALRRHSDLGKPAVTAAFLISADSGFDPKHGANNQASAVWYQDVPYSNGDFMIDNVLRLAFPNFWLHGLTPGAPFADASGVATDPAKFRAYLAAGGDPRPYEPMPATRWGDNVDIVTTKIGAAALGRYKVIVMLGDVSLDSRLRADLTAWVNSGGVLAMNVDQASAADLAMAGVVSKNFAARQATSSTWAATRIKQGEPAYRYTPVSAATADVVATNEFSDPLITRQKLGSGEIYLTTASYLQAASRDQVLVHGAQLLDSLISRYAVASVAGPPVEYIVNQLPGKIVVGLINNSGSVWSGNVTANAPAGASNWTVAEYIHDQPVPFQVSTPGVTVAAQVAPYGVSVFSFEYQISQQ